MYDSLPENNRKSTVSVDNGEEPRFLQIAARIRCLITAGDLEAHTALPSERVLAEEQGVSRMTARHALEALETDGVIYSADRRGRFVSPKRLTYDVSNMVSFIEDARSREKDLEIEVIHAREAGADPMVARHLGIRPGAAVFDYLRMFRTNGHTIFIETEYVDAQRFPGFLDHDLRQSTTSILDEHYEASAHTGDIVIRMRGVDAHEAELLGLTASHPAIELEQVIRDDDRTPFCLGRQVWRGELAEFSARAIVTPEGNL